MYKNVHPISGFAALTHNHLSHKWGLLVQPSQFSPGGGLQDCIWRKAQTSAFKWQNFLAETVMPAASRWPLTRQHFYRHSSLRTGESSQAEACCFPSWCVNDSSISVHLSPECQVPLKEIPFSDDWWRPVNKWKGRKKWVKEDKSKSGKM